MSEEEKAAEEAAENVASDEGAAEAPQVPASQGGAGEAGAAPETQGVESASSASESTDGDEPSEEELAAARDLAEHNALADVFDDVRKQSADSHLVTPDRWPGIGLVPEHMTAEEFEMFVYEWLEDYQAEHKDEIEAEIAAEKAKAASVRSATHAVGVPPKIPNRRLAEIEADEEAAAEKAAKKAADAAPDDATQAAAVAAPAASEPVEQPEAVSAEGAASSVSPDSNGTASPDASDVAAVDAESASADEAAPEDDSSPFAGLRIPEGYKLEQIEGEWVLVEDENAAPVRKEIKCNRIKVLMGMHSYYLYDETLMTSSYAHWAFLAAEDNPVVTFVECVREDSRVYPRPYAAVCLKNPPFRMTDEQIEQTWKTVQESGNYPDIERTEASNGDVYYYSTQYLDPVYAASLAEYDAVERPADV